jgi:hypothetical protein
MTGFTWISFYNTKRKATKPPVLINQISKKKQQMHEMLDKDLENRDKLKRRCSNSIIHKGRKSGYSIMLSASQVCNILNQFSMKPVRTVTNQNN